MTGNTEPHIDTVIQSQGPQGPGHLVRQAREAVKLSLEDLSAQIKLPRNTLDAIERDNFAQLNEAVYVRGYYRKLSKVLPVDEAELLAAYARVAGSKLPPHPSKLILAGGADLGSGRRISLKLTIAIVLLGVLIGALAFWGKNRAEQPVPVAAPVSGPSSLVVPQPELALPVETAVTATPVPATAAPSPAGVAIAETTATVPATSPDATLQPGPLHLQFEGSSWTEVKDATGRVLLSALVAAGNTQVLNGQPPFTVFLGNAPSVKISYNGQPFDMAPFRRSDNTARVTLP